MKITAHAKAQAERIGLKAVAKRAKEALAEPQRLYQPQHLSIYFGSLRLQHGMCDVRLKDNVVYLFKTGKLFQVYALPQPLIDKMEKLAALKRPKIVLKGRENV